MRQERKVVTALFADTVGSTTMGERLDPEDVYELIGEALVRAIAAGEAFGGMVKDLAGDGALMLFGAPVSHEDDAERAVRAGLEIVRSIEQYAQQLRTRGIDGFSMRVGIETGLAVLGPVGGGGKVEYGAMGSALNTAARLQGLAEPGTVVVGPQTFERVAPNFAWGEPREVALKGKSEPVVVRVVQAVLRPSGSSRSLTGMRAAHVGRQAEMATAREAMSQLESGKGGVFLITGAAGVGKSRLVGEVRAAASNKIAWLEARSASYTQRTPYSVFRDLLVDALNAATGEETIERVREQVGQQHADAVTPFAAVLAGVPDTGTQGRAAALSSATLQRGLVDVVRRVLDASRAGRPLVVVVEDLHWTDPSSLDLLGPVIDATSGSAILYVITTRLEAGQASTDFIGEATTRGAQLVKLDPLLPGAAQELLTSLLGPGVLPGSVEQRLLDATVFFHQAAMRPIPRIERTTAGSPTSLAAACREQRQQPLAHVGVHLVELARGVARAEVAAPAAQHRVEFPDHFADVLHPGPATALGEIVDAGADGLHRLAETASEQIALSLEVGTHDPQVAAQEREAFLAQSQFHQSRLGRVQLQRSDPMISRTFASACSAWARVRQRMTKSSAYRTSLSQVSTGRCPDAIEVIEVHVGQQR